MEDSEEEGALCERLTRARQALERERAEAPKLAAELLALPAAVQPCRIAVDPRFQTWGMAELLLARARGLLAKSSPKLPLAVGSAVAAGDAGDAGHAVDAVDAVDAGRQARLALAISAHLGTRHPDSLVQDLRARAWAVAGEACLATSDLTGAADALRSAAACLAHGTGDVLVDARLLEFEAAVRAAQGQPGEALALLKQAASRYRRVNEPDLLDRVLAWREELQAEAASTDAVPHLAFEPIR
jgi:tetratricopeptide (TPR) repeat protein